MTKGISVSTRIKLAKLIARLGSDHDGEVINTRNAVLRVLSAEGADLHDLAALLTTPSIGLSRENETFSEKAPPRSAAPTSPPTPQASSYWPVWEIRECEEHWRHLREVERKFVRHIKWRVSRDLTIGDDELAEIVRISILVGDRKRQFKEKSMRHV